MSIANFIAEKWSGLVELIAQETSIVRRVTGSQYQADATGARIIHTGTVDAITIGDYVKDTDMNTQVLSDTGVDFTIDQQKYFNFSVDDVDKAQSAANFQDAAITQAAGQLGLEADKYIFGLYGDATIPTANKLGTLAVPISITALNVDVYVLKMKTILDVQNAGKRRYLTVPPWFMSLLVEAEIGNQLSDSLKDPMFKEAEILRFAGFDIVMSNSLTVDATADGCQIMAYAERALVLVDQIQKVKAFDVEKQFGEGIKGLYVFGGGVKFGKEVSVLSAVEG